MSIGETLARAHHLVTTDRAKEHGDAATLFKKAAAYWSIYLDKEVTPADVCQLMALLKKARAQMNPDNMDNYADDEGYTDLAAFLK